MVKAEDLKKLSLTELKEIYSPLTSNSQKGMIKKIMESEYAKEIEVVDEVIVSPEAKERAENYMNLKDAHLDNKDTQEELYWTHTLPVEGLKETSAHLAALQDMEDSGEVDEELLSLVEGAESENLQRIKDTVPDYFNKALATLTGCECWEDNQIFFWMAIDEVNGAVQDAVIRFHKENFRSYISRTNCPPCMKKRIKAIKEFWTGKFDVL